MCVCVCVYSKILINSELHKNIINKLIILKQYTTICKLIYTKLLSIISFLTEVTDSKDLECPRLNITPEKDGFIILDDLY